MNTYQHYLAVFNTARKPSDGKPLSKSRNTYRLYKDGDTLVFHHWGSEFARVTPDDVLHMTRVPYGSTGNAYTKFFGIWTIYRKRGVYGMCVSNDEARPSYPRMDWTQRDTPEYKARMDAYNKAFAAWKAAMPVWQEGAKYDLTARKFMGCQPYVPVPQRPLNKEVNSAWRRKVSDFHRVWKVATKMGAYDVTDADIRESSDLTVDRLRTIIETGEVGVSDAAGMVRSIGAWYLWHYKDIDSRRKVMTDLFKRVYARYRPYVREHVGCFA